MTREGPVPKEDPPDLRVRLTAADLPGRLERWRYALEPGEARPTDAAEWAGALVLIESGILEAHCQAGGHRTFRAGDILALGWLPLRLLHNPGLEATSLVAVRRRGDRPTEPFLRIVRAMPPEPRATPTKHEE